MSDNVKVEMTLQPKTVKLITDLTNETSATTGADAISSSIEIVAQLLEEIRKGGQLLLKKKDGSIQQITITGLAKK